MHGRMWPYVAIMSAVPRLLGGRLMPLEAPWKGYKVRLYHEGILPPLLKNFNEFIHYSKAIRRVPQGLATAAIFHSYGP